MPGKKSDKSDAISIVAHQLHTPLIGIKWFTEVLLRPATGPLNDEQKRLIGLIGSTNERLIKLVGYLLDIAHMEKGHTFTLEKTNFDLAQLVDEIIKQEEGQIFKRKIDVQKTQNLSSPILVLADREKLSQVLVNLVDNAVKYSNEGGVVNVGVEERAGELIVYVRDSGIGIPLAQQSKMFEKFFRADNATAFSSDGNGLGLYIAKTIVEMHDGKIWLESEENKGTTFYFSLPLIKSN